MTISIGFLRGYDYKLNLRRGTEERESLHTTMSSLPAILTGQPLQNIAKIPGRTLCFPGL